MKIRNLVTPIEAYSEIASKVEDYVADMEFENPDDFLNMEDELISRACKELEWFSTPDDCVFEVGWDYFTDRNDDIKIRWETLNGPIEYRLIESGSKWLPTPLCESNSSDPLEDVEEWINS